MIGRMWRIQDLVFRALSALFVFRVVTFQPNQEDMVENTALDVLAEFGPKNFSPQVPTSVLQKTAPSPSLGSRVAKSQLFVYKNVLSDSNDFS